MSVIKNQDFEKSKVFVVVEMGQYSLHEIVVKTILKKNTGHISAAFFDKGEELSNELSRFDNFVQIIEGKAEILIDNTSYNLESGQAIIIPANSKNTIIAHEQFKMISTIIKSGYE